MLPPTLTGAGGGGGGGGASGRPPTTPPTTPPGTPPSTPPDTPPSTPRLIPSSGLTCSGTSRGAVNFGGSWMIGLGWTLGVTGALGAGGGGGGGGGGGAAGSTKNALTAEVGSGSSSEVSRGTTMTNSSTIAWMAR